MVLGRDGMGRKAFVGSLCAATKALVKTGGLGFRACAFELKVHQVAWKLQSISATELRLRRMNWVDSGKAA